MPTSFRLENGTLQSLLTTEVNSLANNARTAASAAYDNSAAGFGFLWGEFELVVTFGAAPTAGTGFDLYLIESVDGTNYTDGSSSVAPPLTSFVGSFPLRAVTTAQRIHLRGVPLPPGKWKALLHNNGTGQTAAASGNTLSVLPYRQQGV